MDYILGHHRIVVEGETFCVFISPDFNGSPGDYDCYSPEDVEAWRRGDWRFVGVSVHGDGVDASLWGVELGQLATVRVDVENLLEGHARDLAAQLRAES